MDVARGRGGRGGGRGASWSWWAPFGRRSTPVQEMMKQMTNDKVFRKEITDAKSCAREPKEDLFRNT